MAIHGTRAILFLYDARRTLWTGDVVVVKNVMERKGAPFTVCTHRFRKSSLVFPASPDKTFYLLD
jgi:hypothetical protein